MPDNGADHRPALIGKRVERIGIDALEVKLTTETFIVGEFIRHALLCDLLQGNGILVEAMDQHALQVTDEVLFGVRVITECWDGHAHSNFLA